MLKFLKYTTITLVTLALVLIVSFIVSSKLSMDSELRHATASAALPPLTAISADGLVSISANDMSFRARVAGFDGDTNKPLVVLLHGFPVTSVMWIEVIDPLAQAGYRVIAFDQRGYSPHARPEDLADYAIGNLVSDVFAVAKSVGAARFHLVGHDWGAGVGWAALLSQPDSIISWTGLSIAHPAAFGDALVNDPDQQERSGYFAFFQTPWLPEIVFSFNDFSMLRTAIYASMSTEQEQEYIQVFSEPGALTAALNWYRAMTVGPGTQNTNSQEVEVPTLFIWGNKDEAVGRVAIDAMSNYMKGPYKNIELDAGHWLMEDNPTLITQELLQHIERYE